MSSDADKISTKEIVAENITATVSVESIPELPKSGNLEEIPNVVVQQTTEARTFIDALHAKRTHLVYEIGRLIASTVIILEKRIWEMWSSGNIMGIIESVSWKDELDRELLTHILKLKKARKEVIGRQEMAIVIGSMLENYFTKIYKKIIRNEPIIELQSLEQLVDYSAFTLLYIWAHQTASVHLALNRMDLKLTNWDSYQRSISLQLNTLLRNRFSSIEEEVCTVVTNWSVSTLQGEKPFSFKVTVEREEN